MWYEPYWAWNQNKVIPYSLSLLEQKCITISESLEAFHKVRCMLNIWNQLDIPKNPHNSWEILLLNFHLWAILDILKNLLWVCF